MPSARWSLGKEIDSYLQELRELGRAEKTVSNYSWSFNRMFDALEEGGHPVNARKVSREEFDFLRFKFFRGRSLKYIADQLKILKSFCIHCGNKKVVKIDLGFGNVPPVNVRWLSRDEAIELKENANSLERMVVHLQLDLGLRRIEVLRLKIPDIGRNTINVHGKGRNGGKWRKLRYHPDTASVLEEYLHLHRENEIGKARSRNPDVAIPDSLIIYEKNGMLYPYQKTALDNIVKSAGKKAGIEPISNHDLRRTCGRMMCNAGVSIENIANIIGHSDTKTTIRYLGLDFDDMGDALSQYHNYMKFPKTERNSVSQKNGGPSGI